MPFYSYARGKGNVYTSECSTVKGCYSENTERDHLGQQEQKDSTRRVRFKLDLKGE